MHGVVYNLIRYAWSGVQVGCYGDLFSTNGNASFNFLLVIKTKMASKLFKYFGDLIFKF